MHSQANNGLAEQVPPDAQQTGTQGGLSRAILLGRLWRRLFRPRLKRQVAAVLERAGETAYEPGLGIQIAEAAGRLIGRCRRDAADVQEADRHWGRGLELLDRLCDVGLSERRAPDIRPDSLERLEARLAERARAATQNRPAPCSRFPASVAASPDAAWSALAPGPPGRLEEGAVSMRTRVAIVGNGAVGLSLAFRLLQSRDAPQVLVFGPPHLPGSYAGSSAAPAMINVIGEITEKTRTSWAARHQLAIGEKARALWPEQVARMNEDLAALGEPRLELHAAPTSSHGPMPPMSPGTWMRSARRSPSAEMRSRS